MLDKITENDLIAKGVIGLPDTPGLSTIDMQKKFEELVTDVIVPIFNNNMDKLNAGGADDPAPRVHDSEDKRYGAGTGSMYGHVKLSDDTDISEGAAADSVGASHKALVDVNAVVKGHTTSIANIGAKANNNETRIGEAEGRLTTAETNITNQGTRISTAEQNINTNTQNIATNAEAISRQSESIAEISDEIKVEKPIVVDDYALVESGSGVLNDLEMYGRSKQDKTSGKNLLKPDLATTSSGNIKCTDNGDGTYTLNGTSGSTQVNFWIASSGSISLDGSGKRLSGIPAPIGAYLQVRTSNGWGELINNGGGVNLSNATIIGVILAIAPNITINNAIIKPMICESTTSTYDDFEPYTGGIPSPNPSYPSAIRALSGIKTNNKNLFDGVLESGFYNLQDGYTKISNSVYARSVNFISVEPNTEYAISYYMNESVRNAGNFLFYNGDEYIGSNPYAYTVVTPSNCTKLRLLVFNASENPTETKIQVEVGEKTPYVPYESTESAIPTLYGIPVASGGNYVDKDGQHWISDVTNLDDGKTDRYCGIQELSELSWSLISSVASPYWQAQFTKIKPPSNGTVLVGYSEKYIMSEGSSASMILANNLLGCTDSGYLRCNNGSSTEKPSGLFVYQLATPVTEPIPHATLNSLRQLRSFADKTHIYCDNGSLEAVIAENTEVGNAIGRVAENLNDALNRIASDIITYTIDDTNMSGTVSVYVEGNVCQFFVYATMKNALNGRANFTVDLANSGLPLPKDMITLETMWNFNVIPMRWTKDGKLIFYNTSTGAYNWANNGVNVGFTYIRK